MGHKSNPLDLTGRVAVVTGGATGIGLSLAIGLATAGAAVLIASRNARRLAESVERIKAESGNENVACCEADLAKRGDTEKIVPHAVATFGRVDIVVGNAAQDLLEPVDRISDGQMDQQLEVNLTSNIVLTRAAIPHMRKQNFGRIIFITSIAANVATVDGIGIYSATKSGLHGFARVAALELGASGITVNCVAPGFTMTAMMHDFLATLGEQGRLYQQASAQTTAMNRWGQPDELVGPVLLLASEAGAFMTGTVLTVDGGTSVRMK